MSDGLEGESDMTQAEIDISGLDFGDIDLTDSKYFIDGVPHNWFAFLRKNAPVWWQEEADGPGFWAVTTHADCTAVNRDYEHFSSHRKATFIWDLPDDDLARQQLVMLNMDPPLHTRYRRLVNKGFTPRMVNQLHDRIHAATDGIIDAVIEKGSADFVTEIAAKRADPRDDLMSVLTEVEMEGEKLSEFELELFFLLLTVAGNETTRNLISGAMAAFFEQPDQWELLRNDRSLM